MQKNTPARKGRRPVEFSRRFRQLNDAVLETLEKRQLLTTYVVDKLVDLDDGNYIPGELTLREAINLSNANAGVDNITFNTSAANPTFLLFGGALPITESVNIDGTNLNASGGQAIVNGNNNSGVFTVAAGQTVTIADMTIRQGRAANGGGVNNAGTLTLSNVLVTANSATSAGAGIYNTGTVTVNSGSVVSSNNASATGGGIFNSAGTVIVNGATVQSNTTNASGAGGGIYSLGGTVNLTGSTLTTNASTDGAGIYSSGATLSLTNSTVSNNNAVRFGGGIYNTGSASITINGGVISGNSTGVSGSGAGIYSLSGAINITGASVSGNVTDGPNGGGIRNQGTLNITNSTIANNSSNSAGGGIYNFSGTGVVTVLNSTISGNTSVASDGGGIENTGGAVLRVLNSTISGNSAANRGGGVHAFSGSVLVVNTTVTNNRADSDGNFTGVGGGLHFDVLGPTATMNNTIVSGNFVGAGSTPDDVQRLAGTLNGSNNLIGTGGSGGLVNGVNGNQVGVADALLGPLANNGGSTLTHALLPVSTAINGGNSALAIHPDTLAPFATDQRNGARFIGSSVDIGAFEVTLPLTLVVDKLVDLDDGNYITGELTLREAINLSNGNPGTYNIVFNVAAANPTFLLFSGALPITSSVNIDGTNLHASGGQAIINGNNNSGVFNISAGTVTLADMTIRNGRAANGAGVFNAGNLTLSNTLVTLNSATAAGAGIYNNGTVTINGGSIISSNNASSTGGGIYNNAGTVILNGATVQSNTTNASGVGGGIYNSSGTVSATNSTMASNASTDGAGIYNSGTGTLSLTSSTVSNNNAVRFGGGIYNTGTTTLNVNNSSITGNSSGVSGSGGGIYSLSGTITINNSTVSNNRTFGPNGGGIRNAGTLNVTDSTIAGNIANSSGGGIYNFGSGGTTTILSSTISGNSSETSDGGGIENTSNGTVRVLNSTISGNTAANRGGGIHAFSGTVVLVNSTITNNRADSDDNATGIGGGVHLDVLAPTATMNNTIVADNYVGAGVVEDDVQLVAGSLSGNNNLIGTGGSGGLVNGVDGNLVGVANPMLGALANNGGTTLTHLVLPGSPAIQAGDSGLAIHPVSGLPFTFDQRGMNRFLGTSVDIGAVEANLPLTLVVDNIVDLNNGDFSVGNLTLREALFLANTNPGLDTITFNIAPNNPQFLLFSGTMTITDNVTIDGTNLGAGGGQAIVHGNNNTQIFTINSGVTANFADMTIRNGRGTNGAAINNAGTANLSNVLVTANSATSAGGGIYNTGTLSLSNGTIVSSNNASTTGGGIYNAGGTVILNSSTVQGNTTNASGIGGGIYSTGGSVSLTGATVTTNASTDGGGIYNTGGSSLTLTNSTISNNSGRFGGGIYNTASSPINISNSTISGNSSSASGSGGGIYSLSGTISLTGSTVTNNVTFGPNGGGIRNQGTLNITNSTISNNSSNSAGGGIYNFGTGTVATVLSSTISGNSSVTADGGGVENTGNATIRILNSTISGNNAATRGGGIHAFSGTVRIVNSTITNNRADSDNNATGIGGGLHLDVLAPNAVIDNTIIADNYVGAGATEDDIQRVGGTLSGNNNLVGTGGSGGLVNGVDGNLVGVANPMLGALANNGGTTLTHLVLPGSPAIQAGDSGLAIHPVSGLPFTFDQRGMNRFLGTSVDIGAVEANLPLTLVVDNIVDLNNGDFGVGNLTLREALFLANTNPGLDTITFNIAPNNPQFLLFSGTMTVTDNLVIDGTNLGAGGGEAIIHGNNNTQIFVINNGVTATFRDMTIRNGRGASGGAAVNNGNLTLSNVLVTANTATTSGGGIYNTGTLTLDGGTSISNGNASTTGAGIYNANGAAIIMNNATIQGNAVSALGIGGGIYNTGGTANITGSTITTNAASDGAGIYNTNGGSITLTNSTVSNNNAIRFGGGFYNTGTSTLVLNNSLVTGNSSGGSGSGGGIYSLSGSVTITGSTITNNRTQGPNGGGIRNAGALTLINSTVSNNIANSAGGGIYNTGVASVATIRNSTISGNTSETSDGGGVENTGGATMRIFNSTISGNSAANRGGGVHAFSGNLLIVNSTITNNRADSDNNATGIGGGVHLDVLAPTAAINNTIVADNYVGAGAVEDDIQKVGGTLTGSYNLIGTGGSGGLVNAVAGNIVGVANPRLGALANNGGPTQTHRLLLGSAAIDAGSNALAVDNTATPLGTDQRGNPRIANSTVDIGAVENTINLTAPVVVNEGATYSLTFGPVVDNAADITDYRIDWGDGNIQNLTAAQLTLLGNVVTHVYVDDDPSNTSSDPYTITLDVRDAFIAPSYQTVAFKDITVNNLIPTVSIAGAPVDGIAGVALNLNGSFTDPGVVDTIEDWAWNVAKNGVSVASQNGLSTSFTYTPTTPGHYVVTLVGTDDDTGASIAATKTVHVKGAQTQTDPTDNTKTALFVYGTSGDDLIELSKMGVNLVRVKLNGVIVGTFAPTGRVIVQGGTGNDTISVTNVVQKTMLYGGEGNDTITANGQNDVLVGGAGNDVLVGGGGDDLMVGGDGADNLSGGADEDLLIGGSTAFDAATLTNMDSLADIKIAWSTSGAAAAQALLLGNVTDDAFADSLTGGAANDLFYADSVQDITDFVAGDTTVPI